MKKLIIFASLVLTLAMFSCKQKANTNKFLTDFCDSVRKAYPNREGNDVVGKKIIGDFAKRWITEKEVYEIFDGVEFYVFIFESYTDINGETVSLLALKPIEGSPFHVTISCELKKDQAATIDTKKVYKIKGSNGAGMPADHCIYNTPDEIDLGNIEVDSMELEEVPGKTHEETMP